MVLDCANCFVYVELHGFLSPSSFYRCVSQFTCAYSQLGLMVDVNDMILLYVVVS